MKRKFKTLGLVLVATFAVSAMGSPAASADFFSEVHPQTLSGSQTTNHVFTTNAGTVSCKVATFSGTTSASASPTQTLAPNYENCIAFGFISVPIHENGCAYVLHANGTTEIECPEGKKIEITAPGCTMTIGPQHFSSGMSFSNNAGKTDIVASTNISSQIDYNACGTVRTNGSYTGATTVTGASGAVWFVLPLISKSVTQGGAPVAKCEFKIAGETCQIKFTVTGAPGGWVVDGNNWIGGNSEVRYNKTVKCTPPPAAVTLKDKESCTDAIEARQIAAETENEWCVTFKPEGGAPKGLTLCTPLVMP